MTNLASIRSFDRLVGRVHCYSLDTDEKPVKSMGGKGLLLLSGRSLHN